MYLPLRSTFFRLLQLQPLSFSGPDQSVLHSVALDEQSGYRSLHKADLNRLGNLSPYHNAPAVYGVSADLPCDCTVDQVILLHRHGSRGPTDEQTYINKLVSSLEAMREKIQAAHLPPELEFLKEGYESHLALQNLTVIGRKQLFDHGVDFALRYPTFLTDVVVSTTLQRVIDSAHFFAQGFFGRKADHVEFLTTDDFHEVSWLDPRYKCRKLPCQQASQSAQRWAEKYIPPIRDRLNGLIRGAEFNDDDILGALDACPYDLAAYNESPWCNVFTPHELRGFEYGIDLSFDIVTGHKGDPGTLVGALYNKKLIERLTNETHDAKSLYLEFAHDYTILLSLGTMGLNKDAQPLTPDYAPPNRKFRTSDQTPFAANMVWERFTCKDSFQGPQVRLRLNGETFPLTICDESHEDRKYGTCSLDAFVQANNFSTSIVYQDAFWNATCGRLDSPSLGVTDISL